MEEKIKNTPAQAPVEKPEELNDDELEDVTGGASGKAAPKPLEIRLTR